jgi:hypothetical protein
VNPEGNTSPPRYTAAASPIDLLAVGGVALRSAASATGAGLHSVADTVGAAAGGHSVQARFIPARRIWRSRVAFCRSYLPKGRRSSLWGLSGGCKTGTGMTGLPLLSGLGSGSEHGVGGAHFPAGRRVPLPVPVTQSAVEAQVSLGFRLVRPPLGYWYLGPSRAVFGRAGRC